MGSNDEAKAITEQVNTVPAKKTGVARLHAATIYSMRGLKSAYISEEAFRLEVLFCVFLAPLAFYLGETPIERLLLILPLFLVLVVELLNSAVEAIVDRIGPEYHELSAQAKDIGSAAVFLSLALFAFVWLTILI